MRTMRLQQICRELGREMERLSGTPGPIAIGLPRDQFRAVEFAIMSDMKGPTGSPADFELCGVRFFRLDPPKSPHQWPSAFDTVEDGQVKHTEIDELAAERDQVMKLSKALRDKDAAMGELFERMRAAGVDYSDLIP